MSKFTELCSAYTDFRDNLSQTRFAAFNFSGHVIKNYLDYLGIDNEEAYRIIPLDKDEKQNTKYTPAGATHLGDDGFWHLGFILTVYKDSKTYPQSPFEIDFKFRKNDDDSYIFGVDSINFVTKITSLRNANEFMPVFDKIQECILGYFKEFEDFLVGKHDKMSSIGFIQDGIFVKINSEKVE